MYISSYIVGKIVGKSCFISCISLPSRKKFFLGGTSPKLTTNLFNIKEPLSLLLKMKLAEKFTHFKLS